MRRKNDQPDYILLGVVIALIVLGTVILASVSAPFSFSKFGDTYHILRRQLLFGLIPGLVLGFLAYRINLTLLKKWAPVLLLTSMVLMVMVFLPVIGSTEGGAARWIRWGPFSFQPAELLKITFILYLASWLTSRTFPRRGAGSGQTGTEKDLSATLVVFLFIIGIISLLLILQPDISTLGVIVSVAILMYFSAHTPLWHSILIILIAAGGLLALTKLAPYRVNRLLVFLQPGIDPMGIGYQIKQALIAIGSGGVVGLGLGMSEQKFGFLPEPISDSIFAIFSEETGFVGAITLISLFLIFLLRGFKIAKESQDKFSQLTALGITSWIIIQAFVNIGAMIGLLPLTGIPLPFISHGGSALLSGLIGMGILLNISKNAK